MAIAAIARKVAWRLAPLLMACYFVAFLDRVNVGFAALSMNQDLGFDSTIFGLGAGIFFIGYFFFEVPSNLVLEKVGARRWIARIMFTWGLVSAAMALVWNEPSFYVARFLLGAAEAGFFPGVVLYLTYWFPAQHRARMIGLFMAAVPVSGVIGSPLSGWLLGLDGTLGLHGWQWLFILEGLPSVLLGAVVWLALTDRPSQAGWLTANGARAAGGKPRARARTARVRAHLPARRGARQRPRAGARPPLSRSRHRPLRRHVLAAADRQGVRRPEQSRGRLHRGAADAVIRHRHGGLDAAFRLAPASGPGTWPCRPSRARSGYWPAPM